MEGMTEFERMLMQWVIENDGVLKPLKGVNLKTKTATGYLVDCFPADSFYNTETLEISDAELLLWLYRKIKAM